LVRFTSFILASINKRRFTTVFFLIERKKGENFLEAHSMGNREILIAEDNIVTQNMLRTTLSNAGYHVFTASNGKEAVDLARKKIPGLIILDIIMPEMDGGEVAEILKNDPVTKDIPIIFLSSLVTEREEKVQTKKDVTSFISKPYSRDKLLNEVKKHFN
jgi:CheY-like chemotaxis protein